MAMNIEEAESLVEQLQQAHRLAVGFYRRILPTLDSIANQLECNFWWWEPSHTSRPCRSSTQPSGSWAWDYVPLYASSHTYKKVSEEKQTGPEDIGIKFHLYIEDSFDPGKRSSKGQPDAIEMPKGNAVLRAELFRPNTTVNESFETLWEEDQDKDADVGEWKTVSPSWDAIAFEWPLAQVICDTQPIIDEIRNQIEKAR